MKRQKFFLTLGLISLTACSSSTFNQSNNGVDQTQSQISSKESSLEKTAPTVVFNKGYYVDPNPVSLQNQPSWLSRTISVRAENLPFNLLMNRLLSGSNVTVSYDNSVDSSRPISFNYNGTVKGALDALQAQTHYAYDISSQLINWSAFQTKTFNISFMPGSSDYSVGRTEGGSPEGALNNGGIAASGGMNDQQYSQLSGNLSVWQDLRRSLDAMASHDGRIVVSESTTSVTVSDHPENVKRMAEYIAQLNDNLSQEVEIRVQVLDIQLDKDYNLGINWNVVANVLKSQISLMGNMASGTNLIASNIISNNTNSPLGGIQIGKDNSNALINALNEQGKLRVVTRPTVVTMNNQIASIRITQDTGYIQSVQSSYTENYVTTSITPGTVTDGLTLYVLPKIQGGNVYMQISSTISNLQSLEKESTAPTGASVNTTGTQGQAYTAIEVPTISKKSFNQRSVVSSGSTLIIAGFKRLKDQTDEARYFGSDVLGGKGAKSQNIETLVLITPVIMKRS